MACLAHDALVDAVDARGRSCLLPASRLRAGHLVFDPVRKCAAPVVRVHHFVCKGAVWRVFRYFGLRADGAQCIYVGRSGTCRLRDVPAATSQIERCPVIVGLVLDRQGAHVLADGIVCRCTIEHPPRAERVRVRLRGAGVVHARRGDDDERATTTEWEERVVV